MVKHIFILVITVVALSAGSAFAQTPAEASPRTEQITITTYYPSPFGVYKMLRLYPEASPMAGQKCEPDGKMGDMKYDNSTGHNFPIYCDGNTWIPMSGFTTPVAGATCVNQGEVGWDAASHTFLYCSTSNIWTVPNTTGIGSRRSCTDFKTLSGYHDQCTADKIWAGEVVVDGIPYDYTNNFYWNACTSACSDYCRDLSASSGEEGNYEGGSLVDAKPRAGGPPWAPGGTVCCECY